MKSPSRYQYISARMFPEQSHSAHTDRYGQLKMAHFRPMWRCHRAGKVQQDVMYFGMSQ